MDNKREFRSMATSLRTAPSERFVLEGTAASYNCLSKDLGGFRERIAPGCFTRALASGDDVHCLFNHNADAVLGRTANGTLKLIETPRGLTFRCQLDPNQQSHRDLHSSIKRGDINACSFAFNVDGEDGEAFDTDRDEEGRSFNRRTVKRARLFDVSAVTRPAYDGATSVQARSCDYVIGRNVTPQFERALFKPCKPKSLEQRYFEMTGKEWVSMHLLQLKAAVQALQIRREAMSLRDLRDAERFGTGIMSADEREEWKRRFDVAMGLREPERFPWEIQ